MPALKRYGKQRIAVNSTDWTPIVCGNPCDFFSFRCATSDLMVRTDVADATTEDTLLAGLQETVTVGGGSGQLISAGVGGDQRVTQSRFSVGDTLCWVKSVTASATVVLTWIL